MNGIHPQDKFQGWSQGYSLFIYMYKIIILIDKALNLNINYILNIVAFLKIKS